jgi:adenylate kinase
MIKKHIIILIGPPGSGKGTQAKMLADKFNFKYLGSGDCLRANQKKNNFTGKKLFQVMNKGELVPSFIVTKIMGDELEKLRETSDIKGLILDGWTRIKVEAIMLDEALNWYQWNDNVKVVLIKISGKESLGRLTKRRQCLKCKRLIPWIGEFKKLKECDKCGGELIVRVDDNIQSIKERLSEYKKETIPAINYYKKQKRLIEINGEQSIEGVFEDILKAIKKG